MKSEIKSGQKHKAALVVLVILVNAYIAIQIYWLARPNFSWFDCVVNPLQCVNQTAYDVLIGFVGMIVNLYSVIIVGIIWAILRVLKK